MERQLETYQKIERSIIKKFRKQLWTPFIVAVKRYELIQAGDKIAVCISGGKDSMLMAKLLQELQRHSEVPFELVYLVMDPGYNEINRQKIESNAALLHIPITVFETNIFDVANNSDKSPCYLCARMRRGHLYKKAQELGCNKIALGHHFNDVIETTVMSMFYGSQLQAMPPKLHSTNFPGMTLIRPMYCIREDDIIAWRRYNELEFIQCACRFTEACTICDNGGGGSKRQEVKVLLRRLMRDNPNIENSIFRSIHAVSLDTMPGTIAGQEVKNAVLAACNADETRPLTDHVLVEDPETVEYDIDATYYLNRGGPSAADVQSEVNAAVDAYVKWQAGKLGRDINPSELTRRMMVNGVKRVVIRSPVYTELRSGNVATDASGRVALADLTDTVPQVGKLRGRTVTSGGYEDE